MMIDLIKIGGDGSRTDGFRLISCGSMRSVWRGACARPLKGYIWVGPLASSLKEIEYKKWAWEDSIPGHHTRVCDKLERCSQLEGKQPGFHWFSIFFFVFFFFFQPVFLCSFLCVYFFFLFFRFSLLFFVSFLVFHWLSSFLSFFFGFFSFWFFIFFYFSRSFTVFPYAFLVYIKFILLIHV